MKYAFLIFFLCCTGLMQTAFAQNQPDSLPGNRLKISRPLTFMKAGVTSGLMGFNSKGSDIIFQSGPGTGGDITFGYQTKKNIAIGVGLSYTSYRLNKKWLDQSIANHFSSYEHSIADTADKSGRMRNVNVYLYASYSMMRRSSGLSFFSKLGFCNSGLQLYNVVYRHKTFSNNSEFYLLNKQQRFSGFMPAVGVCANRMISPNVSVYLSAAYAYYFNNFRQMEVRHYNTDGTEDIYLLDIPEAAHLLQINAGLMISKPKRETALH